MSKISTSEISTSSSGTSQYCAYGTKIIRWTSWTDLNPGRRFDACDRNWVSYYLGCKSCSFPFVIGWWGLKLGNIWFARITEEVCIISSGWIMKLVQEENKWSLVCLEDLEQWRRKVEQRKNNWDMWKQKRKNCNRNWKKWFKKKRFWNGIMGKDNR